MPWLCPPFTGTGSTTALKMTLSPSLAMDGIHHQMGEQQTSFGGPSCLWRADLRLLLHKQGRGRARLAYSAGPKRGGAHELRAVLVSAALQQQPLQPGCATPQSGNLLLLRSGVRCKCPCAGPGAITHPLPQSQQHRPCPVSPSSSRAKAAVAVEEAEVVGEVGVAADVAAVRAVRAPRCPRCLRAR